MDGRDESVAAPGRVSMKRGESAASPSADRICAMQKLRPRSKSTNVPSFQTCCRSIVAGDDLARMSDEDGQHARRLRLQANRHALAAEQTRGGIELEQAEPHSSVHVLTIALPYAAPSARACVAPPERAKIRGVSSISCPRHSPIRKAGCRVRPRLVRPPGGSTPGPSGAVQLPRRPRRRPTV